MVLNTSFNENEPVVCKPEEALDCFLRTKMDVLVMGGVLRAGPELTASCGNIPFKSYNLYYSHLIVYKYSYYDTL